MAAHAAEESYDDLRVKFRHHIFSKVPIIVYSAGNYFTQTNTTPGPQLALRSVPRSSVASASPSGWHAASRIRGRQSGSSMAWPR